MTTPQAAALTWVGMTLAIVVLDILVPQPFGVSALGAILEPYFVVTALVVSVVGLRAPGAAGRLLVVALIAIALPRYVPAVVSFPPPPNGSPLRISTWNMEAGEDAAARALSGIAASNAQLMAIEELVPEIAAALTSDATGFRYKAVPPNLHALDVGLLSHHPILEFQTSTDPPYLRAVVAPPAVEPIVVYVGHAPLGRYVTMGEIPVGVDLSVRDPAIALIRAAVDQDLARDRSVVVLGDFNMTEREPAYAHLSAGLRDAHLDAGFGPGFTWRPSVLSDLPFGLLRIDYVLSTPDLTPTSSTVDCTLPSDHCRVDVGLAMTKVSASARLSASGR